MIRVFLVAATLALSGCDMSIDALNGYEPGHAGPAASETGRIQVRNLTETTIRRVHISPCGASSRGENLLGDYLRHGNTETFGPFEHGCYDIVATLPSHREVGHTNVRVSEPFRTVHIRNR